VAEICWFVVDLTVLKPCWIEADRVYNSANHIHPLIVAMFTISWFGVHCKAQLVWAVCGPAFGATKPVFAGHVPLFRELSVGATIWLRVLILFLIGTAISWTFGFFGSNRSRHRKNTQGKHDHRRDRSQ